MFWWRKIAVLKRQLNDLQGELQKEQGKISQLAGFMGRLQSFGVSPTGQIPRREFAEALIDSVHDIATSVNWVLGGLSLPAKSVEEVAGFVGDGVHMLLARAIGGADETVVRDAVRKFRAHYLRHCLDTTRLYPTVQSTLAHLRAKRLAVVTNKPYAPTMRILDGLHVTGYFPVVLGGESTPARKPHPAPVLKALELLGVAADESMMVGDGPHDIEAGRSAGLRTCGVTYGLVGCSNIAAARPDYLIDALEELLRHVP